MAKKKKKALKTTRRRRSHRMGAVNLKSVGMKIAGIAAGAFADSLIKKNFTTLDPKLVGVGEIGLGILLPRFIKGDIGEGLSDGLIASGTFNLLKSFKVISGVGAMPIPARVPLRNNAYSPNAPAIGAAGRPYLTDTVGSMPSMDAEMADMMMGALMYED